jgi:hypothetical protein
VGIQPQIHFEQPVFLGTAHRVATVVAQVTISVADGNSAAVIAAGGVELKAGELFFAGSRSGVLVNLHRGAGPMEQAGVFGDNIEFLAVAIGSIVGTIGSWLRGGFCRRGRG